MKNIKVVEGFGFIEIGLPKTYHTFKSKRYFKNNIHGVINNYLKKIKRIGNVDIYDTSFSVGDYIDINDFGCSYYNKYEKNKEYNVYRFFDFKLLGISLANKIDFLGGKPVLKDNFKTKYGEVLIEINMSGQGVYEKRKL